jgi:PAS domain S-box-containing protein
MDPPASPPLPSDASAAPRTHASRLSLQRALLRLVVVTLLPLALASALIGWQLWRTQESKVEDQLGDTAAALLLAVDRDVAGVRGQLDALAASRLIDDRQWQELHRLMRTIAEARPGAVMALIDPRGQLVVQSNFEFGAPLPNLWQLEDRHQTTEWNGERLPVSSQGLTRRVFASGRDAVSGLYISLVARRPVVGLSVPVRRDGATPYALIYSFPTESLERFFGAPDATPLRLLLLDADGVVIARSQIAPERVGTRPPPIAYPREGPTVQRKGADGVPLLLAQARSDVTGWTVRVAQPTAEALAPAYRAMQAWALAFALVLALSGVAATLLARQIARPLLALATGRGPADAPPPASGIAEIDLLGERLARAAAAEGNERREFERRTEAEQRQAAAEDAARAIAEREQRLRIALDAGGMGTWRVDEATSLVTGDATFFRLWDMPPTDEAISAATFEQRIHPEDLARLHALAQSRAGQHDAAYADEMRVRTADGRWRWIAMHARPVRDGAGAAGTIGVNFDITARRESELALATSEQQFRELTENVNDVFWITDYPARRVLYVSPAYERLWGMPIPAVQADLGAHLRCIHPDDRARTDAAFGRDIAASRFDVEYRLNTPHGERWVRDRGFPLRDAAGAIYRIVGIAQDITERKRSEAQLARLSFVLQSVGDAVVSLDLDGRVQTWNPAAEAIYQWSAAQAVDRPLGALVEPPDGRELAALIARCRRGDPVHDAETVHRRRDGSEVQVAMTLALIRVGGAAGGVAATLRDVTARRLYEAKLREHMHELQAADRRKDHFLAMLGHELRNPLAPIANAARLIGTDRAAAPPTVRAARIIEQNVAQLTRLIDDLLDVARISEGKIVLRRQPVALQPLVQQALEASRALIEPRRHELKVELPEQTVVVDADAARVIQVLTNLLGNAAKYTPDGGRITLAVEPLADAVTLSVADNGIGIAPEVLPQLFVPFAQSPDAAERAQGGLGIGLALVKRLVEMHGGSVRAESAGPGRGSRFTVTLPRATAEPVEGAPLPRHVRLTPATFLVVDDNADAADSLVALLEVAGHRAVACYDGPSALTAYAREQPRAAIVDIGLPGMDGYELARRLRAAAGPGLFIAALTGYGRAEDVAQARAAGFDAHYTKPLLPEALQALLGEALRRAAAPVD